MDWREEGYRTVLEELSKFWCEFASWGGSYYIE